MPRSERSSTKQNARSAPLAGHAQCTTDAIEAAACTRQVQAAGMRVTGARGAAAARCRGQVAGWHESAGVFAKKQALAKLARHSCLDARLRTTAT